MVEGKSTEQAERTRKGPVVRYSSEVGAGEVADPRVGVALPEQLLQSGEIVILLIKPSMWYIVLSGLRPLGAIVVGLLAALWLANCGWIAVGEGNLALLAVFLATLRLGWGFMEWLSRVYVLTDRRVVRIKGVIRVQIFETQLKHIQHTDTLFSLRERLFGLGTITFATAGTAMVEAAWEMVARPLEVHQQVVEAMNRYR